MLIKEQIKIARLIASGTPREVAITESRVMDKKSIVKSGPTIDVKATDMGSEMTAQD